MHIRPPPPLPLMRAAPPPLTELWLYDQDGNSYQFHLSPSYWDPPEAIFATYAFASATGQIGYIGKAKSLTDRQDGHEKRGPAWLHGYQHLYVHVPGVFATYPYDEVERRLIKAISPPMNVQHNPLPGLFAAH